MDARSITFGGSTVTFEYAGTSAADMAHLLLADIAPDTVTAEADGASSWTIRLVSQGVGPVQLLAGAGAAALQPLGEVTPELVLGHLCYHLALRSRGGLLFHAAGLHQDGRGWLLPGTMGAGKTTLAAWLVAQGCTYLTDEYVFVANGSSQMQGFSRPLNLRAGGLAALLAATRLNLGPPAATAAANTLVSPSRLGTGQVGAQAVLAAIIFPRYVAGATFACTPLNKAETGLALMECLVNARNLAHHGFPEIARHARSVPACRLTYSSFVQLKPWLRTMLKEASCGRE